MYGPWALVTSASSGIGEEFARQVAASGISVVLLADINAVYEQWRDRGAEFLTPPADRGTELRCYMRDPDGHLIEVGQTTRIPAQGSPG